MRLPTRVTIGLFALGLAPGVCATAQLEATHMTPPPQPPLVALTTDNFGDLRAAFNAALDRPRVLVMLSPT